MRVIIRGASDEGFVVSLLLALLLFVSEKREGLVVNCVYDKCMMPDGISYKTVALQMTYYFSMLAHEVNSRKIIV